MLHVRDTVHLRYETALAWVRIGKNSAFSRQQAISQLHAYKASLINNEWGAEFNVHSNFMIRKRLPVKAMNDVPMIILRVTRKNGE